MKQSKSPSQIKTSKPIAMVQFDPSRYVKEGLSLDDVLKLKEIFDIFDTNKAGFVSPAEL